LGSESVFYSESHQFTLFHREKMLEWIVPAFALL
jgi:hypothetical protein